MKMIFFYKMKYMISNITFMLLRGFVIFFKSSDLTTTFLWATFDLVFLKLSTYQKNNIKPHFLMVVDGPLHFHTKTGLS